MLLAGFESAVRMRKELLSAATSVAKALGHTQEEVLADIRAFATTAEGIKPARKPKK